MYFGRESVIQQGLDDLKRITRLKHSNLLLVLGSSGSGKSSMVRAGMVPRLKRDPTWLVVDPMRPQGIPFDALAGQLSLAFRNRGVSHSRKALLQQLHEPTKGLCGPVRQLIQASGGSQAMPLLIIDQFEELLAESASDQAGEFLARLAQSLDPQSGCLCAIATLRTDQMDAFQNHPTLANLRYKNLTLERMDDTDLIRAITGPAAVVEGLELEPGLADALVHDARSQDALPLLAFTLEKLWDSAGVRKYLSLDAYQDLGGIEGSVRQVADGILDVLQPDEQQLHALQLAFRQLVQVSENGGYARRSVLWGRMPTASLPLLRSLVKTRLLISGKSETTDDSRAGDTLEVAHESLFRVWKRLAEWLEQDREFLFWRKRLSDAAMAWLGSEQDESALPRGAQLAMAEDWHQQRADELSQTERQYIQAGIRLREREMVAKQRSVRRLRLLAGSLAVALAIALGLGTLAQIRSGQAISAQRETARQLADNHWISALVARDERQDAVKAALHLAAAASSPVQSTAETARFAAGLLRSGAHLRAILHNGAGVLEAIPSPDRRWVISRDQEHQVKLWDARTGSGRLLHRHGRKVRGVRFTPDGNALWWSNDGQAMLLDPDSDSKPRKFTHKSQVKGAKVLRDGRHLLTWSPRFARIWSLETGQPIRQVEHPDMRGARNIETTGQLLTWGGEAGIRLWSGETMKQFLPGPDIKGIALSRDESRLLAWGSGERHEKASLWGLTDGTKIAELQQEARIRGGNFWDNSEHLLTWSTQGIQLWTPDGTQYGRLISDIDSTRRPILAQYNAGALLPEKGQVTIRGLTIPHTKVELNHSIPAIWTSYSHDGLWVLGQGGGDGINPVIWNATTGQAIVSGMVQNKLRGAHISKDKSLVLSWGDDGDIRLWDITPAPLLEGLSLHHGDVGIVSLGISANRLHVISRGRLEEWDLSQLKRRSSVELEVDPEEVGLGTYALHADRFLINRYQSRYESGFRIWDRRTGRMTAEHQNGNDYTSYSLAPDRGWLLQGGEADPLRLSPLSGNGETITLAPKGEIVKAWFSPDENHIFAISSDFKLHIWRTQDQSLLRDDISHPDMSGARQFAGGERIATWGTDGLVRIWDIARDKPLSELAHGFAVTNVASDAMGNRLLVLTVNDAVHPWELREGEKPLPVVRHKGLISAVFNQEGTHFLTGGKGTLQLWHADSGHPLTPILRHRNIWDAKAGFGANGKTLVAWGHEETRVWHLQGPTAKDAPLLEQQIHCGCRLNERGELELLDQEAWQRLKAGH